MTRIWKGALFGQSLHEVKEEAKVQGFDVIREVPADSPWAELGYNWEATHKDEELF